MREKIAEQVRLHTSGGRWTPEGLVDAVLDALMEPTTGMQYAALPLVDRMHQTRDVFVSMIKAAKEGK